MIKNRQRAENYNKRHLLSEVVPLDTPYIVNIDPSGACNFKCTFCPCNTVHYMDKERHHIMELSLFEKIVNDMSGFNSKIKVANLYGFGEPLLNRELPNMVKMLREANVVDEIRITTNGSLMNVELGELLMQNGVDVFRYSIEANDSDGYRSLCGIDVDIDSFRNNIHDLYKIKESKGYRTKFSIKAVSTMFMTENDANSFFDEYTFCSDDVFIENVSNIWSEFDATNKAEDGYTWEFAHVSQGGELCSRPLTEMCIHSNGVVSACCVDWKFATQYGDARNENVVDIWKSKKLREFQIKLIRDGRESLPFCKNCTLASNDNIDSIKDELLFHLTV